MSCLDFSNEKDANNIEKTKDFKPTNLGPVAGIVASKIIAALPSLVGSYHQARGQRGEKVAHNHHREYFQGFRSIDTIYRGFDDALDINGVPAVFEVKTVDNFDPNNPVNSLNMNVAKQTSARGIERLATNVRPCENSNKNQFI